MRAHALLWWEVETEQHSSYDLRICLLRSICYLEIYSNQCLYDTNYVHFHEYLYAHCFGFMVLHRSCSSANHNQPVLTSRQASQPIMNITSPLNGCYHLLASFSWWSCRETLVAVRKSRLTCKISCLETFGAFYVVEVCFCPNPGFSYPQPSSFGAYA